MGLKQMEENATCLTPPLHCAARVSPPRLPVPGAGRGAAAARGAAGNASTGAASRADDGGKPAAGRKLMPVMLELDQRPPPPRTMEALE